MSIEPSLGYWMAGIAGGDDDVGLAVHEAACLVGFDFVGDGGHGGVRLQREGLSARGILAEFVDTEVAIGVFGAVDREDVGDGLRCVGWKVVHSYLRMASQVILDSLGVERIGRSL